jgi:hypothetical protein
MVQRWVLHDPLLNESWTFPVNPNAMTSPHGPRNLTVHATRPALGANTAGRVIEHNMDPYDWQFSGFIRTQEHHDELERWSKKVNRLELTDHLGRTWAIRFTSFAPDEQKPRATTPWRFNYEAHALNYGAVA